MAVSGNLSRLVIYSPLIDTTRTVKRANGLLSAHQTLGVRPGPVRSTPGTGKSTGPVLAGSVRLKGGRI